MDFSSQVAVVTGGAQGIGRGIALEFARSGAAVSILDINQEAAEEAARMVSDAGGRALVTKADVSDRLQVRAAVNETLTRFGKIDITVNNAGISHQAPLLDVTEDEWNRELAVHLSGTFFVMQAVAEAMKEKGYGRIINISSVAALMGPIDLAPYGAAKAGIIGLTRAAALELADFGITVNAIAPGPIETDLLISTWSTEALAARAQHLPISRLGTVKEVVHAVMFLSSQESGFITGSTLPVDGGSVSAGSYMVEKYRRRIAEERALEQ